MPVVDQKHRNNLVTWLGAILTCWVIEVIPTRDSERLLITS